MVWIPSIEYIEVLFKDQIKNAHLINRQGLISTLDKVEWGIPFQGSPNIWDRVTILYKEIVENHYFSDGNKRIGSLIAYVFLVKNKFSFNPPKGTIFTMTMKLAQNQLSFEEIKKWFKKNSVRKI
ncbi:MAG: Death-on-curing family protein [Promethearchaeota archaeon]|nr:MAG: Death-on-curing family protein [Candidatus Lokiarchaeota archaeon]